MLKRKPDQGIPTRRSIADRLVAAADRLFAKADAEARARGWQVTPVYGGFGRRYRDPRIAQHARARAHTRSALPRAEERAEQ